MLQNYNSTTKMTSHNENQRFINKHGGYTNSVGPPVNCIFPLRNYIFLFHLFICVRFLSRQSSVNRIFTQIRWNYWSKYLLLSGNLCKIPVYRHSGETYTYSLLQYLIQCGKQKFPRCHHYFYSFVSF